MYLIDLSPHSALTPSQYILVPNQRGRREECVLSRATNEFLFGGWFILWTIAMFIALAVHSTVLGLGLSLILFLYAAWRPVCIWLVNRRLKKRIYIKVPYRNEDLALFSQISRNSKWPGHAMPCFYSDSAPATWDEFTEALADPELMRLVELHAEVTARSEESIRVAGGDKQQPLDVTRRKIIAIFAPVRARYDRQAEEQVRATQRLVQTIGGIR